jgi:hypothetical protein
MRDEPAQTMTGCLVLVTADGEHFHQTRIVEVTPSCRHIRLEMDGLSPGGLQHWRSAASLQILEAFASPFGPPVMHGILRLPEAVIPISKPLLATGLPPLHDTPANVVNFPLSAFEEKPSVPPVFSRMAPMC